MMKTPEITSKKHLRDGAAVNGAVIPDSDRSTSIDKVVPTLSSGLELAQSQRCVSGKQ